MNTEIRSVFEKLRDRPYCLGNRTKGLDCFSLIYEYLSLLGKNVPVSYEGWDMESYADLYQTEPDRAMCVALAFLSSLLDERPVGFHASGDILYIGMVKPIAHFFAIDIGNGMMLCAAHNKVSCLRIDRNFIIERVFVCHKQSQ